MLSINMASSVDGKIATKRRGPVKLGSKYDSKRMREIRKMHQAVVMGATTFSACPEYLGLPTVVVSSALDIPRHTPWEKALNKDRWIFCGCKAPQNKILSLQKAGIRVVVGKKLRPEPKQILKCLQEAGYRRILLEGGGELNASFLAQGLVDKIFLTLCPLTLGGKDAPTFYEGKGEVFHRWKLVRSRRKGDELYLEYKRGITIHGDLRP